MNNFIQEKVLGRKEAIVRRIKTDGSVEEVAIYISNMTPLDVLVAYLEQYGNNNNSTWTYRLSKFYKLIKKLRFGYSYTDNEGNVYYVRDKNLEIKDIELQQPSV